MNSKWNTLYGKCMEAIMVDANTDTVFFSDLLPKKYPLLYQSLDTVLTDNSIDHRLLENTKDIWCRDYMPIQTDEKHFVFYKYNPNYLQAKHLQKTITDAHEIRNINWLRQGEVADLDLVVDGGNVVRCGDKIVMTEKVFFENRDKPRKEVRRLLEEAFLCDIVFLPWDRHEFLGHSDGIIHYIGENRVIMTNYGDFDVDMEHKFNRVLEKHFEVIPLSYNVKSKHQRSWAYVNFLQIGRLVIVPQLGIPEDEQALQQISDAMPICKVIGVPALEAVRKGGALNCISWNVATTCWNNGFMGEEYRVYGRPISWIKKAAEEGRANWQCNLGICYFYGKGVEKDLPEASKWYKKAAEQGEAKAQFNLGLGYFKGVGVPQNYAKAIHWFSKASEQGDADAKLHIAWCLEETKASQEDIIAAYRKAAEMGNSEAQCELGFWYCNGNKGLEKNITVSNEWFRRAAEQGCDEAQFQMGLKYEFGNGVKKDMKEAVKWYRRAVLRNNIRAIYQLGCCYYYGDGVRMDNTMAFKYFKRAVGRDYYWAEYRLGECYYFGYGIEEDKEEAVKWYSKAASKNIVPAVYELGYCYFHGFGVNEDKQKALEYLRQAAENNHPDAICIIGDCYRDGIVVKKDDEEAIKHYKQAAELGCKSAQKKLHDLLLERKEPNFDDVPF